MTMHLSLETSTSSSLRTPRSGWLHAFGALFLAVAVSACSDAPGRSMGPDSPDAAPASRPGSGSGSGTASTIASALLGANLYVSPNTAARRQADAWRTSRPADAAKIEKIASQPSAIWLGEWTGSDVYAEVSKMTSTIAATGATPVYVVYNIPLRDCGLYSRGGASSPAAYSSWVADVARGIAGRRAVVIMEPDAVPAMDCLTEGDQQTRLRLIRDAVRTLKAAPGVSVYIDAGNAGWHAPVTMAPRLREAGIDLADGFALNVSNFFGNAESVKFGTELSGLVSGKHFVIDTSRNGLGPSTPYEWCNPAGRAIGTAPTTSTGIALVDAFLWVKPPGESDGECNGGPAAGHWWAEYAIGLVDRARG